jgi:DUF1009 family protein
MSGKLGVVAGGGRMPALLVEAARRAGRQVFVLALEGQTDPGSVANVEHAWIRLGAANDGFRRLHEAGVTEICLAGKVSRPSMRELRPDLRTARFFARIGFKAFGDDGLLKAVLGEFESEGFRVVAAEEILGELLAPSGRLGAHSPTPADEIDIARGVAVLRALGPLDVGQAIVVERGLVLGIEAIEGTDAMIERCAALKRESRGGVVVKLAKIGQERRVDLPAIGVLTVERVAAAGFHGIAIEGGQALIVDRSATIAAADRLGIFVMGLAAAT